MAKTLVDLTGGEQVQGTLPVANGGTGSTTLAGAGIYTSGGTDVAIADGGTGASSAATALSNLKAVAGSSNGTATALTLWTGTAAQYAAIGTKDSSTVYVVTP